DGKLHHHPGCGQQRLDGTGTLDSADLFLLETPHEGNQAHSPEEVLAVRNLVESQLKPDATWTNRNGIRNPLTPEHILVIAPYNAQVSALRRALAAFGGSRVGTVDKFQGQEAPIVIYSCTSSSPQDAPRGMSFLYDPHRLESPRAARNARS
ncbi:MAG: C-terminal helicase domain-containing protein, partial [Planctomycetota bacterium]